MAITTQGGAVTGRRRPPNYLDIINAQAPYLPYYKEAEDKQKQWQKGHNLEKRALRERTDLENRRLDMTAGHYRDLKKRGRRSERMGWANVGLGAGLGLADLLNTPDLPTDVIQSSDYSPSLTEPLSGYEHGVGGPPGGTEFDIPFVPEFIEDPIEKVWDWGSSIYEGASDFISDIFDW